MSEKIKIIVSDHFNRKHFYFDEDMTISDVLRSCYEEDVQGLITDGHLCLSVDGRDFKFGNKSGYKSTITFDKKIGEFDEDGEKNRKHAFWLMQTYCSCCSGIPPVLLTLRKTE